MKNASDWQIPKWPFLAANAALIAVAAAVIYKSAHPISDLQIYLATGAVVLGAVLGCLPFLLEYRATKKLIEVNAVTTVVEQLHDLKTYSAQVGAATDQWARLQEATKGDAEKTVAAAKEIADRMAAELREFAEFQQKMNDSERATLRLEVEKLRRAEAEWLQTLVRVMDHISALHTAAVRSGQPELASQIGNFQNACRGVVRRVGLVLFGAEPGEKFDAQKHRAHGVETPAADSVVAEVLAPGVTFQSQPVRPALVRLQDPNAAPAAQEPAAAADETPTTQLSLKAD